MFVFLGNLPKFVACEKQHHQQSWGFWMENKIEQIDGTSCDEIEPALDDEDIRLKIVCPEVGVPIPARWIYTADISAQYG